MPKGNDDISNGRPVRLKDIADRCGLGVITVSRALRGDEKNTAKSTMELVQKVAREMGYDASYHHAARRLALSKFGQPVLSHTIGLLFFHHMFSQSNYFVMMMQGIFDAVTGGDFEVHTSDTRELLVSRPIPLVYRRGEIDGILTMSQEERWKPLLTQLRAEPNFGNRPIVGLVEHLEGCSGVYADNYQAGSLLINHLLDLGHRYIVVCMGNYFSYRDAHGQRYSAYLDSLRSRGLDPDTHLIRAGWHPESVDECAERMRETLEAHPEATALIPRNDFEALQIYKSVIKDRIRIPEDLSFISYDDTDVIMDGHGYNILTSVHLPLLETGREGAKLLIRRILGEEKDDRDIVLPTHLVERKSTAPPNPKRLKKS